VTSNQRSIDGARAQKFWLLAKKEMDLSAKEGDGSCIPVVFVNPAVFAMIEKMADEEGIRAFYHEKARRVELLWGPEPPADTERILPACGRKT
jgi:hypothetical protein